MSGAPDWLPPLITLEMCGGNWDSYLTVLYGSFQREFIRSRARLAGKPVRYRPEPIIQGKEATFWHLISEGAVEPDRLPDLRRCERIRWPRALIDGVLEGRGKLWKTRRGKDVRVLLALDDFSYVVVLTERQDYVILVTAFCVDRSHRQAALRREFETYAALQKKTDAAP